MLSRLIPEILSEIGIVVLAQRPVKVGNNNNHNNNEIHSLTERMLAAA